MLAESSMNANTGVNSWSLFLSMEGWGVGGVIGVFNLAR